MTGFGGAGSCLRRDGGFLGVREGCGRDVLGMRWGWVRGRG